MTTFGGFLDSSLDRVVDMALLLGLVLHYAGRRRHGPRRGLGGALRSSATGAGLVHEGARRVGGCAKFEGGLLERAERVVILGGSAASRAGCRFALCRGGCWARRSTAAQRIALAHRLMREIDVRRAEEAPHVA